MFSRYFLVYKRKLQQLVDKDGLRFPSFFIPGRHPSRSLSLGIGERHFPGLLSLGFRVLIKRASVPVFANSTLIRPPILRVFICSEM